MRTIRFCRPRLAGGLGDIGVCYHVTWVIASERAIDTSHEEGQ